MEENKRITFELPRHIYERFLKCTFRLNATTDSEALRAMIINITERDQYNPDLTAKEENRLKTAG